MTIDKNSQEKKKKKRRSLYIHICICNLIIDDKPVSIVTTSSLPMHIYTSEETISSASLEQRHKLLQVSHGSPSQFNPKSSINYTHTYAYNACKFHFTITFPQSSMQWIAFDLMLMGFNFEFQMHELLVIKRRKILASGKKDPSNSIQLRHYRTV